MYVCVCVCVYVSVFLRKRERGRGRKEFRYLYYYKFLDRSQNVMALKTSCLAPNLVEITSLVKLFHIDWFDLLGESGLPLASVVLCRSHSPPSSNVVLIRTDSPSTGRNDRIILARLSQNSPISPNLVEMTISFKLCEIVSLACLMF